MIEYESATTTALQATYTQLRTSTLTQIAAGAFGIIVGMTFWQVFQATPANLTGFATAVGALLGAVLMGAIDALTPQRTKRRHVAVYVIGLLIGVFLMIALLKTGTVDPLKPAPTSSSAPSAAPTAAPS